MGQGKKGCVGGMRLAEKWEVESVRGKWGGT